MSIRYLPNQSVAISCWRMVTTKIFDSTVIVPSKKQQAATRLPPLASPSLTDEPSLHYPQFLHNQSTWEPHQCSNTMTSE